MFAATSPRICGRGPSNHEGVLKSSQSQLERIAEAKLPTPFAEFRITVFRAPDGKEHVVIALGELAGVPPLIRIHSECLTGDALFSLRCDCGAQLNSALQRIDRKSVGSGKSVSVSVEPGGRRHLKK